MNEETATHEYFAAPLNQADEVPAPDPDLQAEMEQFLAEAQAQIDAQTDPREQHYMMRLDTKTLIKSNREFTWCEKNHVPIKYGISYTHALHLVAEEGAQATAKKKRRAATKNARKARARNRR